MTTSPARSRRTLHALAVVLIASGIGAIVLIKPSFVRPPNASPSPPAFFSAGQWAQLTELGDVELHGTPAAESDVVATVVAGQRVFITDEGVSNGEGSWIRVQGSDAEEPVFGWIRQVSMAGPLRPIEPPSCPERPNVLAVVYLAPAERLACFRSGPLTFETAAFEHVAKTATFSGTPEWLAGPSTIRLWGELGVDSPGGALDIAIPPGISVPSEPGWYRVSGQFDDRAAETCDVSVENRPLAATEARLWCREQFVVTAITRAPPPKPSRDTGPGTHGAPG